MAAPYQMMLIYIPVAWTYALPHYGAPFINMSLVAAVYDDKIC
jgi:hypothetical protein